MSKIDNLITDVCETLEMALQAVRNTPFEGNRQEADTLGNQVDLEIYKQAIQNAHRAYKLCLAASKTSNDSDIDSLLNGQIAASINENNNKIATRIMQLPTWNKIDNAVQSAMGTQVKITATPTGDPVRTCVSQQSQSNAQPQVTQPATEKQTQEIPQAVETNTVVQVSPDDIKLDSIPTLAWLEANPGIQPKKAESKAQAARPAMEDAVIDTATDSSATDNAAKILEQQIFEF